MALVPSSITPGRTGSPRNNGSRKQWKAQSSRNIFNDLEFTTELGSGFLSMVRELQIKLDESESARWKAEEKEILQQQVKGLEQDLEKSDGIGLWSMLMGER